MAIVIKIGVPPSEVDRTSLVDAQSLTLSSMLNERAVCDFTVTSADGSYRPVAGHSVLIDDGATRHFAGSIDSVDEVRITPAGALRYAVHCVDYNLISERRAIRSVYLNKKASEIVTDLRTVYFVGDSVTAGTIEDGPKTTLTAAIDASQTTMTVAAITDFPVAPYYVAIDSEHLKVTSRGVTPFLTWTVVRAQNGTAAAAHSNGAEVIYIFEKEVFDHESGGQALDRIAERANRVWYIDGNKALHFIPRNQNVAPFSLGAAGLNFMSIRFRDSRDQYNNRVYLRFAWSAFSPEKETFNGNGSNKTFTLTGKVSSQTPTIKLNGTEQSVGVKPEADDPGKNWYWGHGEDTIVQAAAATALVAADALEITYYKLWDDVYLASDDAEINARQAVEGGSGIYEYVVDHGEIAHEPTAQDLAENLLRRYKAMAKVAEFDTDTAGLRAGQLITINLPVHGVNSTFLIEEVRAVDTGKFLRYTARAYRDEVLDSTLDFFRNLAAGRSAGTGGGGGGGGAPAASDGNLMVKYVLLTANTTIAVPPEPLGSIFVYVVEQNATGGWTVSWNVAFKGLGSWRVDPAASTYSALAFWKESATSLRLLWGPIKKVT